MKQIFREQHGLFQMPSVSNVASDNLRSECGMQKSVSLQRRGQKQGVFTGFVYADQKPFRIHAEELLSGFAQKTDIGSALGDKCTAVLFARERHAGLTSCLVWN